ncbi:BAG domain-containing protein Samui-like isoform X2 [Cylas formicarius]|uniref:BAG domain-containing protein Samui-like isoform X2 n=1 Tax=Cylas formicarius TaxID=197179 RepID=UPI0029585C40|nr:BAG domain-containing protein Samui-like isoform X2 [Cylas formicarius]
MPFSRSAFTGFPFGRDDDNLQTHLDDITQRHPELSEHFRFPRRRPERPFGTRFERFGFPFDEEDETRHRPQYSSPPPPTKVDRCTQTDPELLAEAAPATDRPRNRPKNIQQSNTCDLASARDAADDRQQRSYSAPPPSSAQRFVTSIDIPVGREPDMQDGNGSRPHTSTERVIPIHVEGRDVPIVPKNVTSSSTSGPPPERIFTDRPAQPETIFGQRPEQFTQFVREPKWRPQSAFDRKPGFPEDEPAQQQQQQDAPPQPEQPSAPSPKPQPPSPIDQIRAIQKDVSELLRQVELFDGAYKDKNYLYLDEMLTRNLLKLDDIDTQGQDSIRSARKEAVKCIEKAIGVLESKAAKEAEPASHAQEKQAVEEVAQSAETSDRLEVATEDSGEVRPTGNEEGVVNDGESCPREGGVVEHKAEKEKKKKKKKDKEGEKKE